MTLKPAKREAIAAKKTSVGAEAWLPKLSWGAAIIMVALMLFVLMERASGSVASAPPPPAPLPLPAGSTDKANLPAYEPAVLVALTRGVSLHTIIPDRPHTDATQHTVEEGDSIFALADQFKIKPETILWANYSKLNDNPDLISVGLNLMIPPVDGVFYQWRDGDTLQAVADKFHAKAQDILLWPGNNLDLTNPVFQAGSMIMIPGGRREFVRNWVVPTIPRGRAGVTMNIAGTCDTGDGGAYGTGGFIWPTSTHTISGNDYWSGHLAIDIGAGMGTPVVAADSGVVVFSGWNPTGYGNMIMIDHGNGYQTVYAHLSTRIVGCGQSVYKGGVIAYSGSSGNSTGPHLHFEVRYMGGFINPHSVLP